MARTTVLAAGGIVLRREDPARGALGGPRQRKEWGVPQGKLDAGGKAAGAPRGGGGGESGDGRSRPLALSEPLPAVLEAPPQQPELVPLMPNEPAMAVSEIVELAMPALLPTEPGLASQEAPAALVLQSDVATRNAGTSVVKKVQDWLRRVRRPDRAAASGR